MTRPVERRTTELLVDEAAVRHWLATLDPRDCVFWVYDVADPAVAERPLACASAAERLLAGVAAGPVLWPVVMSSWPAEPGTGGGPDAPARREPDADTLTRYLGDRFPPLTPVPAIGGRWRRALREIARGAPGDPVPLGLFPSTPSKLARLALAAAGDYPAPQVRASAVSAYDRGRRYHGHDALACALAHPGIDAAAVVADLVAAGRRRGWRSRGKTNQVLAWARATERLPSAASSGERRRPAGTPGEPAPGPG